MQTETDVLTRLTARAYAVGWELCVHLRANGRTAENMEAISSQLHALEPGELRAKTDSQIRGILQMARAGAMLIALRMAEEDWELLHGKPVHTDKEIVI